MKGLIFLLAASAVSFLLGILNYFEKGLILDDDFWFASKQKRESMDRTARYRLSAAAWAGMGLMFLLNAFRPITGQAWFTWLATAVAAVTAVYVIVKNAQLKKKERE